MTNQPFKLGYVPALDGMRGAAILVVLGFHAEVPFLKGGFIGVDIFFVLSGFLITSLLIQEYTTYKAIRLRNFYIRRILRLAPALIFLLLVFSILSILFLDPIKARSNLIDSLISFFYLSNWARAFNIHPPDFLAHTWSLAIEEQFYILWPPLLILLLRYADSSWRMFQITVGLAVSAWLLRVGLILTGASIERLYNGLDTRADTLLAGCALAIVLSCNLLTKTWHQKIAHWLRYIAPLTAILLIYLSIALRWRNPQMYYWILVLIEVLVVILILDIFVSKRSSLRGIFAVPPLVWIGKISYGLYLWHLPVFLTLKLQGYGWLQVTLLGTLLTFAIASLSYFLIERPCLKLKQRFVATYI
jgi:peptidoglycan/LPS O-acetylase OafA/YrhL